MNRFVWFLGWFAVAIWSAFAFAAYGLIDLVGRAAMRSADMFSADPDTVEWIWRGMNTLHGLSTSIVLAVWGFVTLAILAVPWIFDRLTRAVEAPLAAPPGPSSSAPSRDGVIDLAPGDYTVRRNGASAKSGVTPRIAGRTWRP